MTRVGLVTVLGHGTNTLELKTSDPNSDSGACPVTVPALPGCVTEGRTFEEAFALAREAIADYVEDAMQRGKPVPLDYAGMILTPPKWRCRRWRPHQA